MDKVKKNFRNQDLFFAYDVDPALGGSEWDEVAECCIQHTMSDNVFIDVGANIGYISALVGKFSRPKLLIAVEPDIKVHPLLAENIFDHSSAFTKTIVIGKLVLDGQSIRQDFFLNLDNPAQNSIYLRNEFGHVKSVSVWATTIDEIVEEHQIISPIVLKIDAEFAEPLIWRGMQKSLHLIKAIIMEFDEKKLLQLTGIDPAVFLNELKKQFAVSRLNKNNLLLKR